MDSVVNIFAIRIPLFPLVLSLVLVPFVGIIVKVFLGIGRKNHHKSTEEPLKDGLDIVHEGPDAEVDLVAVHGLGANPNYAWTANVGRKDRFRWLERLLPQDVPNTRIMTFSFQSNWLMDAPKTRTTQCATSLLNAVHNKRRETETTNRPIIFMGHSFGGNLIERAIVSAHLDEERKDIVISTAGVVFFGTPHRGSNDASWGRIIAEIGSYSGFDSHDGIIKDLQEESTNQIDLLHDFSIWLKRMSVDVVCFFELKKTDYGRKIHLPGIRQKIVVTESSACIDGYAKVSLDVDHLHLNQFNGPEDSSYKKVRPEIKKMVDGAPAKIRMRLNPRPIVCDDGQIRLTVDSREKLECLHALFVAESEVTLENLRRTKGDRVEGTCEWVLVNTQYAEWLTGDKSQLLRLIGMPGIGKSMIATFLVDELKERSQYSESTLFAFFFCDNKDERQRTATAVLRSLLVQLLRQQPSFFKYVLPEYEKYGKDKFQSIFCMDFGALWMVFEAILRDPAKQSIYILIDALDECEEVSKSNLVKVLHDFFDPDSRKNKSKSNATTQLVKMVITHRPEQSMEKGFGNGTRPLKVDSGQINHDLSKFIGDKTKKLQDDLELDSDVTDQIRDVLEKKAEGTFLWVSLVLGDMDKSITQGNITDLLNTLPSDLDKIYERILQNIKPTHEQVASFILRIVFIAHRPLSIDELATVCLLGPGRYDKSTPPTSQDFSKWRNEYRCCGAFLKLDEVNQTIHLVHQSAKDFLTDLSVHGDMMKFYPEPSISNLDMLQICLKYFSLDGLERLENNVWHSFNNHSLLNYASPAWQSHAIAAYPAWVERPEMDRGILDKLPLLRDEWLLLVANVGQEAALAPLLGRGAHIETKDPSGRTPLINAAETGREAVVELLLDKGAEVDAKDVYKHSSLSKAARNGYEAIIKLLLNRGAEINPKDKVQTPLSLAAEKGHEKVVKLLLENGAEIETADLLYRRTPLLRAAEKGHEAAVRVLLDHGAKPNAKDVDGRSPILWAADNGHEATVRLLIDNGAEVDSKDRYGYTSLIWAAMYGHETVVRLLIDKGAQVDLKEPEFDQTPLSWAAENGHEVVVKLLLANGAQVDWKDTKHCQTPLSRAAMRGHQVVVKLLLDKGAEIDSTDEDGFTPLLRAVKNLHEATAKLLLDKGADVNSRDKNGTTPISWAAKGEVDLKLHEDETLLYDVDKHGPGAIVKLLLHAGAEVNSKNFHGQTPLLNAIAYGREVVVKILLDNGANVNLKDDEGQTPLLRATVIGRKDLVKLLLDNGARVNAKNKAGQAPLLIAVMNRLKSVAELLLDNGAEVDSKDGGGRTPLSWAGQHHKDELAKLLLDNGAEVNSVENDGQTPLSWAARNGNGAVVRLLLSKNAEVNLKDTIYGQTPLSRAAEIGHVGTVELLLDSGAEVDSRDRCNGTPLLRAAECGHEGVVKVLLERGADVNSRDHEGHTPLSLATRFRRGEVVKLLLEKGAEITKGPA